jgi:hypothetical protein
MSRSWITAGMVIISGLLAFVVASPLGGRIGTDWMPAVNFAIGSSLVLVAMLEGARSLRAWYDSRATLGWIAGGLVAAFGAITAGTSFILHARHLSGDSTTVVGIIVALLGLQWQARAGRRSASPA